MKSILAAAIAGALLVGCVVYPVTYSPEVRSYYYGPAGDVVFVQPGVIVPFGITVYHDRGWYHGDYGHHGYYAHR